MMRGTGCAPLEFRPRCPHCQGCLSFVASWSFRSLWGYDEVRTYECLEHGPIFIGPQSATDRVVETRTGEPPDDGDRDSLVPAPLKPAPTRNAAAAAMPEPDSN
jgi:hypothetical protein